MKRSVRSLLFSVVAFVTATGLGIGVGLLVPSSAEAATGFTLGPVDTFYVAPPDPIPMTIEIASDGTFSYNARQDYSIGDPALSGTYEVHVEGNYDFASGAFSGTFAVADRSEVTKHGQNEDYYTDTTERGLQGTISGQADPNTSAVTLTFSGRSTRHWHETHTDQSHPDMDDSSAEDIAMSFAFPVQGTIPPLEGTTESTLRYGENGSGEAVFSDIYGQVEVNFPNPDGTYDEENWTIAKFDVVMPPGTHIKTSEKSGAILSFSDMNTFTMMPETEIILTSLGKQDSQIELLGGQLLSNIKRMLRDGSMEIEYSQAVAGIKGTRFLTTDNGNETTLTVTEGTVAFTSRATGESVDVSAGESVTATGAGLSAKSTVDIDATAAAWDEMFAETQRLSAEKNSGKSIYVYAGIAIGAIVVIVTAALLLIVRSRRRNSSGHAAG